MTRIALLGLLALAACAPHVPSSRYIGAPLYVVSNVTPAQIAGKWYEIASFPAPFQAGCSHTTAEYAPQPDGSIALRNSCRVGNELREITGTATVAAPGRLKVDLAGVPFRGDYWILGVSRDGQTLVVGTPTRIAGWVLHRDREMTPQQLRSARDLFEHNGYDAAALQRTDQR